MGRDISEGIRGPMTGDGVMGLCSEKRANCENVKVGGSSQKGQYKYIGMLVDKHMHLKVSQEHAVQPYMAAKQRIRKCMAFWLGCMRARCGVHNICKKAVSSKASCKKGTYAPEAFSRCEEHCSCHKLASTERMWPRSFAVLLVKGYCQVFNSMHESKTVRLHVKR
eukprot:225251-Pelagomonas_calceolata.AAC.3